MQHNITRHCIALTALFTLPALSLLPGKAQAQFMPLKTMNFQGRLAKPDGTPLSVNTASITFSIWDSPNVNTGNQLWTSGTLSVPVSNGTFATKLDFTGGFTLSNTLATVFNGSPVYLQMEVNGGAPLTPRQPFVSSAYALLAGSALTVPDGSITASKFTPNILNPLAWLLGGNSGVTNGFIGTTDNNPLDFRVNNQRGLRLEWAVSNQINVIGGHSVNNVKAGVYGAVIGGGGYPGSENRVTDYGGVVAGGGGNIAGSDDNDIANSPEATVSGGFGNRASGRTSVVAGGARNTASGDFSAVPGGGDNTAAGFASFAAGTRAKANHPGTFVWNDNPNTDFASTGPGQFLISGFGGVGIKTNAPTQALDVNGGMRVRGDFLVNGRGGGLTPGSSARALVDGGTAASGVYGGGLIINFQNDFGRTLIQGPLDISGPLKVATGGVVFPNGTTQTSAGWSLTGNSGTKPSGDFLGTNFIGTTDNVPLEIRVNSYHAMRYTYAEKGNERSINVLGGSGINAINGGVIGATIAGGGDDAIVESPNGDPPQVDQPNRVTGDFGTVGGGAGNTAFMGAAVGGGFLNTANGYGATIAGGVGNTANGNYSFTVGVSNFANGDSSFAAGVNASAIHSGAFVWADNTNARIASTGVNQFLIRAAGGVGINTNAPQQALSVNGGLVVDQSSANGGQLDRGGSTSFGLTFGSNSGEGIASNRTTFVNQYGLDFYTGATNRMSITNGGNVGIHTTSPQFTLDINGTAHCTNSSWSSDARYKTHIATLDNALDKVLSLRGVSYDWDRAKWPAKNFAEGKQVGFIAQELEKIFPELVQTDREGYKSVNYIGVVPVAVEAIKTLNAKVDDQQKQIEALKAQVRENAELKRRLDALTTAVEKLTAANK